MNVLSNEVTDPPVTHPAAGEESVSPSHAVSNEPARIETPEGKDIVLRDVKMSDTAVTDIETVISKGIMSGYQNKFGTSIGVFGANDILTYAQIAKIAVKIANVEPSQKGDIKNDSALNTWAEQYVRTAEENDWGAFNRSLDVNGAASKKMIVQTLLDAAGIKYGTLPNDALKKAVELGVTSVSEKRALTRREIATMVVKILNIKNKKK